MNDGPQDPSGEAPQDLVELELAFTTMRQLQAQLAPMLSNDGLFVPADEPLPVDTVVRFRLTLPEGFVLIEGTGVVIWTRSGGGEGQLPGMAIRYVSLSAEAQETIDAIIDSHLAAGGELFDLEPDSGWSASFPTDALGGAAALDDSSAARLGSTRQELERARLTIRGVPAGGPPASLDDEYLDSVEAQVEEAVAGIGRGGDSQKPRPPHVAPPAGPAVEEDGADAVLDEILLAGQGLGDGEESGPPRDGAAPASAESAQLELELDQLEALELAAATDEDDTLEILRAEPMLDGEELAEVRAGAAHGEGQPGLDDLVPDGEDGQEPEPVGERARDGLPGEVVDSVIPEFLERWKEEIGAGYRGKGGGLADADRPSGGGAEATTGGDLPGAAFEVDVVQPAPEDAPPVGAGTVRPLRAHEELADEVTLVPVEEPPRHRVLAWVIPLFIVVVIGGALYLERGRLLELLGARTVVSSPADAAPAEPDRTRPEQVPAAPAKDAAEPSDHAPADAAAQGAVPAAVPAEEPAAEPPAEEAARPAEVLAPANAVNDISWRRSGASTELLLVANGAVEPDAVSVFPMRDPARILVRVRGIAAPYPRYELPVSTPEVERIRIGHHPELRPPSLYVVLDLADPMVGATDVAVDRDTIRVTVAVQ